MCKEECDTNTVDLVIGIVSPLGSSGKRVAATLEAQLEGMGYSVQTISLSSLIKKEYSKCFGTTDHYLECLRREVPLDDTHPRTFAQMKALIEAGDKLCAEGQNGADYLIRQGCKGITAAEPTTVKKAVIIRSLRREEEIAYIRQTWAGKSVILCLAKSDKERAETLVDQLRASSSRTCDQARYEASELIFRDRGKRNSSSGQQTGACYEKGDYFLRVRSGRDLASEVSRFVRLVHGDPHLTPTPTEQLMALANTASKRSGDFGKQVGVVFGNQYGDVLATGANEVAKANGGQYWDGDVPDHRDFATGFDPAYRARQAMIREIVEGIAKGLSDSSELDSQIDDIVKASTKDLSDEGARKWEHMKDMRLSNLMEFGRVLHAEMAAITTAARLGTSLMGSTAYVTYMPCHMCMRLLIGVGVSRIVYANEFPKGSSIHMYSSEVEFRWNVDDTVSAVRYEGVALDNFSAAYGAQNRKTEADGAMKPWRPVPGELNNFITGKPS